MWHDSFTCYMTHSHDQKITPYCHLCLDNKQHTMLLQWLNHIGHGGHDSITGNMTHSHEQGDTLLPPLPASPTPREQLNTCVWHDTFIRDMTQLMYATWLIRVAWKQLVTASGMTHLYVLHHSFIWDTTESSGIWLICMCDKPYIYGTWLVRMRGVACSCVWHDSSICVTWLIHMCDTSHQYVRRDSFVCVTWLIHMCDMTHLHEWHDSSIWDVTQLVHLWRDWFICVTWLIHMCDMTQSRMWPD